jgi:hypothetical protein
MDMIPKVLIVSLDCWRQETHSLFSQQSLPYSLNRKNPLSHGTHPFPCLEDRDYSQHAPSLILRMESLLRCI